ncbi:hypothetical protein LTR22_002408 [Elasticomyces elasticus]|nr:hypothetical protein LTR22_002408 [Elasticomyces elasticus]KAK4918845.1 hypothetical protein LTR49_013476 [Elasticomyces elasticus]KAK5758762.1 hypothetical protein LTS12_011156 [Elasticomyces elasticus]
MLTTAAEAAWKDLRSRDQAPEYRPDHISPIPTTTSIMSVSKQHLHWTQRVALVRHNLHSASRTGDFTFFKTLQAMSLLEGTNHVASLSAALGDDADVVLMAMDNLNAGLAYVHEDAFKNVYDTLKNSMRDENKESTKSKLYVDVTMQKNMADMAIDKMSSSAIALINQQPSHVQEIAVNVWITGATIVADVIEVTLQQMDSLETKMDDFIRLEDARNIVKSSLVCAVTGLKGVFLLMDPNNSTTPDKSSTRSASIASAGSAMFRRLSTAFAPAATNTSPTHSRNASVASASNGFTSNSANFNRNSSVSSLGGNPVYRTPNYVRNSVSHGCPTSMPASNDFFSHKLSMIPPTPAFEESTDPFDMSVPPVPAVPEIAALQPVVQT